MLNDHLVFNFLYWVKMSTGFIIFSPTTPEAQPSSEQNDEYSNVVNMMDFNFLLEEAEEERK